jgi:hypothetical protein
MRARHLMGVVAAVAVLAGCGQSAAGKQPEVSASASPSPEQTASISQEEAEAALLSVTDLPDSWMPAPSDSGSGTSGSDDSGEYDPVECDPSDMPGEESVVSTSREYLGPMSIKFRMRVQSGLSDPPEETLDALAELITDCPVVSAVTSTRSYRAEQALTTDFPELGERTLAVSQTVKTSDGGPREIHSALVIVEDNLITFTTTGPSMYAEIVLDDLASLGVDKYHEIVG